MTELVEISGLNIRFTGERTVYAVNDLNLSLGDGEVLGLLGESGSGKSVTLRALLRLLPRKRTQISGSVRVMGRDVLAMDDEALSAFRGQTVSMIFQEPALALDPVYTIGRQIAETVMRHEGKSFAQARARALEMLEVVRIPSAKRRLDAYPHEMSGGMRQRAMIALALACRPKILLADEPTTALDATVQIQILLLLRELQREFGMSVIFVTHDIGVAIEICDRVAVMYAGQIVEQGSLRDIVRSPVHPYARGLLASTIHGAKRGEPLETIPGTPPSLDEAPHSCSFAPRCAHAQPRCLEQLPPNVQLAPERAAGVCWRSRSAICRVCEEIQREGTSAARRREHAARLTCPRSSSRSPAEASTEPFQSSRSRAIAIDPEPIVLQGACARQPAGGCCRQAIRLTLTSLDDGRKTRY